METITIPTDVFDALIQAVGDPSALPATQRRLVQDAQDIQARHRTQVTEDPNAGGAEQLTLFDADAYLVNN